jgi:hypothetical protein
MYVNDCRDAKNPISKTFISGELEGWFVRWISSPMWATACANSSSLTEI